MAAPAAALPPAAQQQPQQQAQAQAQQQAQQQAPGARGHKGKGNPTSGPTENQKAAKKKLENLMTTLNFNTVQNITITTPTITDKTGKTEQYNKILPATIAKFNECLKDEKELLSIEKKVKSYKSKLPGFSFVTDKLNVKINTEKGELVTPESRTLEKLIIENRDLIHNISENPSEVVNQLSVLINNILSWEPTPGSSITGMYKYEYNVKYDNFFINEQNVKGFINEMKNTILRSDNDENKSIKLGKLFKYLPQFSSLNLNNTDGYRYATSDYTKAYSEHLKAKTKKDKPATTTPSK